MDFIKSFKLIKYFDITVIRVKKLRDLWNLAYHFNLIKTNITVNVSNDFISVKINSNTAKQVFKL